MPPPSWTALNARNNRLVSHKHSIEIGTSTDCCIGTTLEVVTAQSARNTVLTLSISLSVSELHPVRF